MQDEELKRMLRDIEEEEGKEKTQEEIISERTRLTEKAREFWLSPVGREIINKSRQLERDREMKKEENKNNSN